MAFTRFTVSRGLWALAPIPPTQWGLRLQPSICHHAQAQCFRGCG